MRLEDSIHYWLGALSMVDEIISELRKYDSELMRDRLAKAEQDRADIIREIERIAEES